MSVSENISYKYNPLVIYGGVKIEKTHLLHAIGQKCASEGLTVMYIS
ncbi:MAG: chromosomal replication initiator protein DnaA, partial [Ignavibacteriaceae bacterium]|nr:chromosomal replication initiator protein DnaA [Ignavibacteriaceae bacterium]